MVLDTETRLRYTPFEVAGFALLRASTKAIKFFFNASISNEARPIVQ
jgi:hypothetical protein